MSTKDECLACKAGFASPCDPTWLAFMLTLAQQRKRKSIPSPLYGPRSSWAQEVLGGAIIGPKPRPFRGPAARPLRWYVISQGPGPRGPLKGSFPRKLMGALEGPRPRPLTAPRPFGVQGALCLRASPSHGPGEPLKGWGALGPRCALKRSQWPSTGPRGAVEGSSTFNGAQAPCGAREAPRRDRAQTPAIY